MVIEYPLIFYTHMTLLVFSFYFSIIIASFISHINYLFFFLFLSISRYKLEHLFIIPRRKNGCVVYYYISFLRIS